MLLQLGPSLRKPELRTAVTIVIDKGLIRFIGHKAFSQGERCQIHRVTRQLVVKTKALLRANVDQTRFKYREIPLKTRLRRFDMFAHWARGPPCGAVNL